jgi:hypothetical protein
MSACVNRDQELWREQPGDFYSDSIHVTESGGIGINVGGKVLVAPAKRWHDAGMKMFAVDPKLSRYELARLKAKRKRQQKVWAVIDMKYGIVGLYATKRLATKACDDGIGLDSGYAGTVQSMVVRKSVGA